MLVARNVAVLFPVSGGSDRPAASTADAPVHLLPGVNLERPLFQPDAAVATGAAFGGTKADRLVSEADIDDLLGAR